MRKAAHEGKGYLITGDDLNNFSARVILGFDDPKYVDLYPRVKPAKTKSVVVAPLEEIEVEPNVVVVITDPNHAMQIIQVLTRATKKSLEATMTCQASAIAGEAVALPFMEQRPNLTLLCGGARGIAGYSADELALGLPLEDFIKLADLLVEPTLSKALCGCLMDELPKHLKEAFSDFGFEKGTDHFYGDFRGKVFRFYLAKDEQGRMTITKVHYPMKFKNEEEAKKSAKAAIELLMKLEGTSSVLSRENWLDLILTVNFPEGLEKIALDKKEFEKTITNILTKFSEAIDKIEIVE